MPVFWFEFRAAGRRRRGHLLRAGYASYLMLMVAGWWWTAEQLAVQGISAGRAIGLSGAQFAVHLATVQIMVALLAGPASAADALGPTRRRGLLGHALLTDFSAAEIVLGTAAARLATVVLLLLAGVPMTVLAESNGAIGLGRLATLVPALLGMALLGVSAATALSLRTRRPYETLFVIYGIIAAWLAKWMLIGYSPPSPWQIRSNPFFFIYAAIYHSHLMGPSDAIAFLGVSFVASLTILAWTSARLRAVVAREGKRVAAPKPRRGRLVGRLPGPRLDGNPVLWREWRHGRRSRWGRIFWAIYALGFACGCFGGIIPIRGPLHELTATVGFAAALGLLAAAIGAASCWAEERAAGPGGLDVLLATPLSTSTIVYGKWWASYRVIPVVALAIAIPTVVLAVTAPTLPTPPRRFRPPSVMVPLRTIDRAAVVAVVVGRVLADGAALVGLGVWLATRSRKTATAVVAAVSAFVFIAIVVPISAQSPLIRTNSTRSERSRVLTAASPLLGPLETLNSMFYASSFGTTRALLAYQAGWLLASATAAAAIRWRTIRTFDRTMGRMPDGPVPVSVGARRRGPGR